VENAKCRVRKRLISEINMLKINVNSEGNPGYFRKIRRQNFGNSKDNSIKYHEINLLKYRGSKRFARQKPCEIHDPLIRK